MSDSSVFNALSIGAIGTDVAPILSEIGGTACLGTGCMHVTQCVCVCVRCDGPYLVHGTVLYSV